MPLVSVIVNIRNGERYLRAAIDSVRAQTWADWQLIAWDDRSDDGSADIVRSYSDPRITYYLSPATTLLGEARQQAIALAQGEWIAFLDQDDIWLPDKLSSQMDLADGGVGIIYCRTVAFNDRGREWDYDYRHEFTPLPEGNILESLLHDSCFIAMSSAVLRAAPLQAIAGSLKDYQVAPDYYIYLALAGDWEARAVQSPLCRYRAHGGNMSHWSFRQEQSEALRMLAEFDSILPSAAVAARRRVHSSALAVAELRGGEIAAGLRRLLRDGSVPYLASRPPAIAWRWLRRQLFVPHFQEVR